MIETRILGKTDFKASCIALGTVQFGLPYGPPQKETLPQQLSVKESHRILDVAVDYGINIIDTAAQYGDSEAVIGQWKHPNKQDVCIASKLADFSLLLSDTTMGSSERLKHALQASIERSRKTLKMEVLPLLQIHNATPAMLAHPVVIETLLEAKKKERIRWMGATTYGQEAPLAALENPAWDVLQLEWSVLNQSNKAVIEQIHQHNTGLITRSVFIKGLLAAQLESTAEALKPIVEAALSLPQYLSFEKNRSPLEIALLFALGTQGVHSVLMGVESAEQLESNLSFLSRQPLVLEELQALAEADLSATGLVDPRFW
jgi:aryl-alcohol dehydrogenase-like predicted oxidoreductase